MPIYEYECRACGKKHEIIQKHSDNPVAECPDCRGSMRKLISNSSFVLKGTGWYKTDYASGSSVPLGAPKKTEDSGRNAAPKTEVKAEAKPEAKPEAKSEGNSAAKPAQVHSTNE